jgi:hypothetical protein
VPCLSSKPSAAAPESCQATGSPSSIYNGHFLFVRMCPSCREKETVSVSSAPRSHHCRS